MPPNDELFSETAADASTETAAAPATPEVPAPLTAEQVSAIVAERTAPVTQQLSALQRENEALKLAISQAAQQVPAQPAVDPSGFVDTFNKDPLAAVREVAQRESAEGLKSLAPHLNTLISSANEAFLGAQQTRIEQEFGTKAWTEVYQPALTARFAEIRRSNPFGIADINLVRREVNLVTGEHLSRILALRDEHNKGRTTSEQANIERIAAEARKGITTNLTGGIRTNPKGGAPDLDDGQREALAHYNRVTGQNLSASEYAQRLVATQTARDVDEWLAQAKPAGRA